MRLGKLQIGLFIVLFMGMCVLPATAIKIADINYVLDYPGGSRRTADFYAQKYDTLYIKIESNDFIEIQVRYETGLALISWNDMSGVIDLHYTIPEDTSYYVYLSNAGDNETSVVGVMYLNEEASVPTTHRTTPTTPPVYVDPSVVINILTIIYGFAGALFVVSIFVYRRRKNPHFKFLTWFDDDELLPVGWQPTDEEDF
jgi:hypothetical protein